MKLYILTTFLLITTAFQAQTLTVSGFAQKGNKVEINYEITGGTAETVFNIKVKGYDENAPNAFLPMKTLQGTGKQTGNGKRTIIWDAGNDMNNLLGYSFVFEVSAEYTVVPDHDLLAYQAAQTANTCQSYTDYLSKFANGKFKTDAQKKKTELCKPIVNEVKKTTIVNGSFTDPRDGKTYKTVTIDNQTWFAENLAFIGDNGFQKEITNNIDWEKNSKYNAWCYHYNDASIAQEYGVLYQWEAAKRACPTGWHLPTDDDWKTLEKAIGMSQASADSTGLRGSIGNQLKATSGWNSYGNGTNESSFSALPGGYRYDYGRCYDLGKSGHWWSSSAYGTSYAWNRGLYCDYDEVDRSIYNRSYGFSVRCVRD